MAKLNINEAKTNLKQELSQKLLYSASKNTSKTQLYSSENIESLEYLTQYGNSEDSIIYVFKSKDKIILTPSDDNFKTILAIYESDDFNLNELPPNVKDLILSYSDDIQIYNENHTDSSTNDIKYGTFVDETIDQSYKEDWVDIPEILPYRWGQGYGYSSVYTPFVNIHNTYSYNDNMYYEVVNNCSIKGETVHVISGCAITAASMLMAYVGQYGINIKKRNGQIENKKYKVGSAALAQKTSNEKYGIKCKMPALPAIETFNYNFAIAYKNYYKKSNDRYVSSITTTAEQKTNIATFLRYIQQGFESACAPQATSVNTAKVITGLKKFNWGYPCIEGGLISLNDVLMDDYFTRNIYRYGGLIARGYTSKGYKSTPTELFESAIYRDLKKGIPVVLYGKSKKDSTSTTTYKDSEHNFNCDGYQKDTDLWHFNFGWMNHFNGWYSLRSITPDNYIYTYTQMLYLKSYPNEYYNDFIEASKNKIKVSKDSSDLSVKIISHAYQNNTFIDTSTKSWGVDGFTSGTSYNPVSWLTLSQDSDSHKSNLNIHVEPNTTSSERTYTITVYKTLNPDIIDTIQIIQEPSDTPAITYTLDASPTSISFNYTGGETKYITVTISPENTEWSYKKLNTASWISTTKTTDNRIKIVSKAHTNTTEQSCDIKIYLTNDESIYKTVRVTTKKYVNISVAPSTTLNFDSTGGVQVLTVDATEAWEYTYVDNSQIDGLTITKESDNQTLTFTMNSYNVLSDRTCSINIHTLDYSAYVIVTINAAKYVKPDYSLTISPKTVDFTSTGGTKNVTITVNPTGTTWTYELVNPSQTISGLNVSKSNNRLTLTMSSYTNEEDRTCQYKIISEDPEIYDTLTVNAKKYLNISIDPTEIIFESIGGSKVINITTNDNNWTYTLTPSNTNWLIIDKGSRTLGLEVEENTTITTDRTCTITFKTSNTTNPITKQVSVKAKKYVNIYATESNIIFDSSGGTKDIDVISTDSNWRYEFMDTPSSYLTVTKNNNTLHLEVTPYTVEQDNSYRLKLLTSEPDNLSSFVLYITLQKYIRPESTLIITRDLVIFDYLGGVKTIPVESNTDWNIQNFVCSWLTAVKTDNETITLTATQNNTTSIQTQSITVKTTDNTKQKTITVKIQPNGEIITGTVLKLSSYDVIFNHSITTAKIEIYSNTTYYIETNSAAWLTYNLTNTNDSNIKILELTSNYNSNNNTSTSLIIHTSDDKETATLNIYTKYEIQPDDEEEDNIGETDEDGNVIIGRNGQNINISIYGQNGVQIIKNKTLLNLYIDQGTGTFIDITGNIILENNNLIYHLNIPQNLNINKKLFKIYGTYLYDNQHEVSSRTLSFIQNGQIMKLYITVNKEIFLYDDTTVLDIKYWAETSDNTHVYNTNDLNLILDNNFSNPITYSVISDQIISGEQVKNKKISLNNNTDSVERKLNLKVVYSTYLTKNLIITQLSSEQHVLNAFDFLTLEYNIQNDFNNYISVNDYTNPNQLTNINSYGGEGLQLIAVLSGESADGNIPINKTINGNLYDLGITWVGYNQEVNGNNTKYSQYLRYSGQNNNGIETESMLINLYSIIQNLYSETTNINIDIYGHWTNTRSTGKIKTKLKTYKNSPINIQLNNYTYSVDNNTIQTIESVNNVYDLTNKFDDLTYYTHLFKLTYNIKYKTGLLFNIEQTGEYAKNIFVFSPGYEERFITKYVDNEYYTEMYINKNSGTYKVYLHNSIYQTYNNQDLLSQYQLLLESTPVESYINLNKNSLTFTENGGIDNTVIISTNTEYEIILNYESGSDTGWLTYTVTSNRIKFTATQNNRFVEQKCTVTVRSIYDSNVYKTLLIKMNPATVYLNIVDDITAVNFDSYVGGQQTITVNSNDSWTATIQNKPSQISYQKISNTVKITASENSLTTDVNCTLVITCVNDNTKTASISITLPGKVDAELSITKSNIILPYYGTSEYVTVNSNINWNLTSTAAANSGIEITKDDSSHIKITSSKNMTANDKDVTITVKTDDNTIQKTINLKVEKNNFLTETKENWNDMRLLELHDGTVPVHLENMEFNHLYNVQEVDNIVKSYDFPRCHNWDPQTKNITVISQRQTANQSDEDFIAYLNSLTHIYMLTAEVMGLEEFDFDVSYYDQDRREEPNENGKRYISLTSRANGSSLTRVKIAMNNGKKIRDFIENTNNNFVGIKFTKIYFIKASDIYSGHYECYTSWFGSEETEISNLLSNSTSGWSRGNGYDQTNDAYFTDLTTEQVDGYTKYINPQFSAFDAWSKNWIRKKVGTFNDLSSAHTTRNIYQVKVGNHPKSIVFKNDFILDGSDDNDNICGGIILYNHLIGTEHSLNLYKLKVYKTNGSFSSGYGYRAIAVCANSELDQLRVENCEFKGLPTSSTETYTFPYNTGRIITIITQAPRYNKTNLELYNLYNDRIDSSHLRTNANRINHIYLKDNLIEGGDEFTTGDCTYCVKSFRIIGNTFTSLSAHGNAAISFGTDNSIVGNGVPGYFSCPIYIIDNKFYGVKKVRTKRVEYAAYFCTALLESAQVYYSGNIIKNLICAISYYMKESETITYNNKDVSYTLPRKFYSNSSDSLAIMPIYSIFQDDLGTITSNGQANQTYILNTDITYNINCFTVKVNDEKWSKVTTLNKSGTANRKEYSLTLNSDYTINLKFGSGTYSKIPENGAIISITYDGISSLTNASFASYDTYFSNVKVYFVNNKVTNLINMACNSGNQGILKAKGTHIPWFCPNNLSNGMFYDVHGHVTRVYKFNSWKLDFDDAMFKETIGNCGVINHQTLGTVINPTTSYHFKCLSCWGTDEFDSFKSSILSKFNTNYSTNYATFDELLNNLPNNSNIKKILNGTFNNPLVDYLIEENLFNISNGTSVNSYRMFPVVFGYTLGAQGMPGGYRKFIFSNNEIDYQNCGKMFGGATGTGGAVQKMEFNDNKISVGYIIQNPYSSTGNLNGSYMGNQEIASINQGTFNSVFPYYPNRDYYANGSTKNECYLICENNEFNTHLQENCKIALFMLKYSSAVTEHVPNSDGTITFLCSNLGIPGYIIFKNNKVNNILDDSWDFEYIDVANNFGQYPINSLLQINRTRTNSWSVGAIKKTSNTGYEYNDIITKEEIGYDNYEPSYITYSTSNITPNIFSKSIKNIIYSAGTINITITESTGIISNLGNDSIGKYLQLDAPNSSGTYNIVLNIGNINSVKFKVIVI